MSLAYTKEGSVVETNQAPRRARLFRNNRNQAVRIPVDLELPGSEAIISRDGDRLIIEPIRETNLLELLTSWQPLEDEFPDVDETLPPLRDVSL